MPTLEFKGKPFVYSHHLSVPFRELVIDPKKSFPGGKQASLDDNLIIHGDNLEALKALLPRYAGKVDVIYIDPPYNTGNERWIYNDNVNSPLMKQWLGKLVDRDDLERHDKWLCMMWPRVTLLRELLSPRGAIFVSIDDVELGNLISLMTDVFDGRHVATIPVVNNMKGRNDKKNFARTHEYIVIFDKGRFESRGLPLTAKQLAAFRNTDERGERYAIRDMRKRGGADTRIARPNLFFPVYYSEEGNGFSLKRTSRDDIEIFPRRSDVGFRSSPRKRGTRAAVRGPWVPACAGTNGEGGSASPPNVRRSPNWVIVQQAHMKILYSRQAATP
jgi:adenine-specific DNA-methyltransferase